MRKYLIIALAILEIILLLTLRGPLSYLFWFLRLPLWWRLMKVPKFEAPRGEMPMNEKVQEAKFLALQTQINPHFLYNTLEGIRSEALLGSEENAATMAELLANYFRYSISQLDQLVTVEDELNNLANYLEIQRFRFKDRIQTEIIFEGDETLIKSCVTPKLILQPIVENALQHGLEPLKRQGHVTLRFLLYANLLLVIISDDGVGMEASRLALLNQKMKDDSLKSTSIGIENVNKRIQILFGKDYGLRFTSQPNLGTDVEVSLPVRFGRDRV